MPARIESTIDINTLRAQAAEKICQETGCYSSGSAFYNGGTFFGLSIEEVLTMTVVPLEQPSEVKRPLKQHLQTTTAENIQIQPETTLSVKRASKFRSTPLVAAAATLCGLGRVF